MNTHGYLYENKFNPINPSANKIELGDFPECYGQFAFKRHLKKHIKYLFVMTTYAPNNFGSFSINVFGPNNVTLKHSGE